MTEQEQFNSETQMKLAMQDAKFNVFMQEMRDFKTEMRDRDNQRLEDIREIRQDMKTMQASLDGMTKHFRNITIATMAGVGTSVVAVVVLVGTTLYALLTR